MKFSLRVDMWALKRESICVLSVVKLDYMCIFAFGNLCCNFIDTERFTLVSHFVFLMEHRSISCIFWFPHIKFLQKLLIVRICRANAMTYPHNSYCEGFFCISKGISLLFELLKYSQNILLLSISEGWNFLKLQNVFEKLICSLGFFHCIFPRCMKLFK